MLTRFLKLRIARNTRSSLASRQRSLQSSPSPAPLHQLSSLRPTSASAPDLPPPSSFPLYRPDRSRDDEPSGPSTVSPLDWYSGASGPSDAKAQRRIKERMTRAIEVGLPEYTEDELREFYVAVVQSAAEERDVKVNGNSKGKERAVEVPRDRLRLGGPDTDIMIPGRRGEVMWEELNRGFHVEGERANLLRGVAMRLGVVPHEPEVDVTGTAAVSSNGDSFGAPIDGVPQLSALLAALDGITAPEHPYEVSAVRVPLGILTTAEWGALLSQATVTGDASSLMQALELMERHAASLNEEALGELLRLCTDVIRQGGSAAREDIERVGVMIESMILRGAAISQFEHHAILTFRLSLDPSAHTALAHLKHFESLSLPAPQSAYAQVLAHLTASTPTHRPTSVSRALAWDLFAHMRLVAHATPTAEVYRVMITACASAADPRPEMARDLWLEMTLPPSSLMPAEPEYTAIIRALAPRVTYLEGFELFRQMLARHEEATYTPFEQNDGGEASPYVPSADTWKALLEGTKRAGDLARARWVLGEAIRMGQTMGRRMVDEEVVSSLFMTYAAWLPSVKRAEVRTVGGPTEDGEGPEGGADAATTNGSASAENVVDDVQPHEEEVSTTSDGSPHDSSESAIPLSTMESRPLEITAGRSEMLLRPGMIQTSSEAIKEVNHIFHTLVTLQNDPAQSDSRPLAWIQITPRLANSFLSVHYAHAASIDACRGVWDATWGAVPARPNGWSYMYALERCSMGHRHTGRRHEKREDALSWAEDLWASYRASLASDQNRPAQSTAYSRGFGARQIEKAWRAIIRTHAICGDPTRSLAYLDEFHATYPPDAILAGYRPRPASGLAIQFSDPTMVPEADVPPHLLFADVDVLHQRLVRDERAREVRRVTAVVKAYERALAKRRKWRLGRARPKASRRGVGSPTEGRLIDESSRKEDRARKGPVVDDA